MNTFYFLHYRHEQTHVLDIYLLIFKPYGIQQTIQILFLINYNSLFALNYYSRTGFES